MEVNGRQQVLLTLISSLYLQSEFSLKKLIDSNNNDEFKPEINAK